MALPQSAVSRDHCDTSEQNFIVWKELLDGCDCRDVATFSFPEPHPIRSSVYHPNPDFNKKIPSSNGLCKAYEARTALRRCRIVPQLRATLSQNKWSKRDSLNLVRVTSPRSAPFAYRRVHDPPVCSYCGKNFVAALQTLKPAISSGGIGGGVALLAILLAPGANKFVT